jgi:hypothetical protein
MTQNDLKTWLLEENICLMNKIKSFENDFNKYYKVADIDCQISDEFMIDIITNLESENDKYYDQCENALEQYNNDINILIPVNTNASYANNIFKEMIDFVKSNKLINSYINEENIISEYIFNIDMKESFYKFCMENTR